MLNELGALLKYEFRYYFRFLPLLYVVLIIASVVLRLRWNPMEVLGMAIDTGAGAGEATSMFVLLIGWFILIGGVMGVITIVNIIQRFINNFMKDPGSLMFTLPVTIWTLLAAKIVAAFCMVLMSSIAVCVSALILVVGSTEWLSIYITETMNLSMPNFGEVLLMVFTTCATTVANLGLIYVAITISHLLPRFRFAVGCAIFIAISSFVEQPVYNYAVKNTALSPEFYVNPTLGPSVLHHFYAALIPSGIAALVFAAVYFWATGLLIKRTLNLE
jgi:hypothetical protein